LQSFFRTIFIHTIFALFRTISYQIFLLKFNLHNTIRRCQQK